MGLEGNSAADQEAKQGSTMPQSTVPMDFSSAAAALKPHQRSIAEVGTSAIHMPRSIEFFQAASTVTSVGNGIGPGTSA